MRKRGAALLLSVLLLMQMVMPSARAAKQVCFVAAGENILTLSDDTMPFWHNGFLYISSAVFTGTVRDSLNISRAYNQSMSQVVLYSGEKALLFDTAVHYTEDTEGNRIFPGVVRRNGTLWVPAATVANYFGLQYSFMTVPQGQMVWLRRPDSLQLSDSQFADAATFAMTEKYNEYIKATAPAPEVETPTEVKPDLSGKVLYLCLKAGEDASAMLDALGRMDQHAAFFCDLAFLEQQGALLRRMTAAGQAIGLLADGKHPDLTVEEQLAEGNRLLEQATCGRTRLARIENGTEKDEQMAAENGYCCLDEDLDRSQYSLRNGSQAENLRQRLENRRSGTVVWLGEDISITGFRAFLTYAEEAEDHCLAWRETV